MVHHLPNGPAPASVRSVELCGRESIDCGSQVSGSCGNLLDPLSPPALVGVPEAKATYWVSLVFIDRRRVHAIHLLGYWGG